MNANSVQQMPAIKDWLTDASHRLYMAKVPSANLDAEIILADTLHNERTYLHAHPEQIINANQLKIADAKLASRLDRLPIAYIVGYKEFYGRQFLVNPATLIPRPESEDIITMLGQILPSTDYHLPTTKLKLVDVGTGSGCLGITAKLEFPRLDVTLTDISDDALKVATKNAKKLSASVAIIKSDLLQNYSAKSDIIIANLPYVDQAWGRSPETNHEPAMALFADNHGQLIIEELITQASNSLSPGGHMIIEADPVQHSSLIEFAKKQSFTITNKLGYIIAFEQKAFD